MRSYLFLALTILAFSLPVFSQEDIKKERVLVVLDNLAIRDTHSLFFQDLENEGYNVDFKVLNYDNFKIQEFGEYHYDQLILFCTSVTEPRLFKTDKILEFFDSGRNVLIAADVDTSKVFRQLINQFGVETDQFGSRLYDDIKKVGDDNTLFATENLVQQDAFSPQIPEGILYRGIGLTLSPYENFQTYGVLRASEYTYSKLYSYDYSAGEEEILNTGNKIILAAGVQGRNNARALITGSLDLFSNELYAKSNGRNRRYARSLVSWNFGESGVLKVDRIYHHFANDASYQPSEYKLYDDIVYEIDITTWDSSQKRWVPYVANDIQLEFVMLDPYIRMPLTHVPGSSTYKAEFKIPDKHGVFQFKVTYRKPGFSFIQAATKIPVRPFKHNEYERFLFEAYPYYLTVFATLVGFFVFVAYFLFDASKEKSVKKEQ